MSGQLTVDAHTEAFNLLFKSKQMYVGLSYSNINDISTLTSLGSNEFNDPSYQRQIVTFGQITQSTYGTQLSNDTVITFPSFTVTTTQKILAAFITDGNKIYAYFNLDPSAYSLIPTQGGILSIPVGGLTLVID